jgi:hypothetical protein
MCDIFIVACVLVNTVFANVNKSWTGEAEMLSNKGFFERQLPVTVASNL